MKKIIFGMLAISALLFACTKESTKPVASEVQIKKKLKTDMLPGLVNLELDATDPVHPFYFAQVGCTILKVQAPIWDSYNYPNLITGVQVYAGLSLINNACGSYLDEVTINQGNVKQFTVSTIGQGFPDFTALRADLNQFQYTLGSWYLTQSGPYGISFNWGSRPQMKDYVSGTYSTGSGTLTVQRFKIVRRNEGSNQYHLALAPADYPEPAPSPAMPN